MSKRDRSYASNLGEKDNSREILSRLLLHEDALSYGGLRDAAKRQQEARSREQILMCKDVMVYNITSEEVYAANLLPGCMAKSPCTDSFRYWMRQRYSSGTNTFARQMRGLLFGQGNRERINMQTRALSYVDCYWIKDRDDEISFQEVSPYFADFWSGDGAYQGEAIPTLYVAGALAKRWNRDGTLYKEGNLKIELDCIDLCRRCQIPVEEGYSREEGICLTNFTSDRLMLEQANESGLLDPEDFSAEDILRIFGLPGLQMLAIDAIIGNGDRHAGNFGFLRDADSGLYQGMAPLYDFDHALDSSCTDHADVLMKELAGLISAEDAQRELFRTEVRRICACAADCENEIFRRRAELLNSLV